MLCNILLSPSDWAEPCSSSCLKAGKRLDSAGQAARVLARLPRTRSSALLLWTLHLPTSHACVFVQRRLAGPLIACVSLPFSLLLETTSTLSCWHDEAWFCHARTRKASFEKTLQICLFIKQIIIHSKWPQSSLNIWQLQPRAVFNGLSSSCSPRNQHSDSINPASYTTTTIHDSK